MPGIDNMYPLSAGLELFAGLIMVVLLLGCSMEPRRGDTTDRLFITMLVVQTFLLFGDAAIWLLLNTPTPGKVPLVKALTLCCDIMTAALTSLYAYFLAHYVAQKKRVSFAFPRIVTVVCGAMILVWIVCLFNDWYIWYGADGSEHEGPIYGIIQLTNSILLASGILFIWWNHKVLGRRDTLILSTYGAFPFIGYLLDPYWPITPTLLATTLSLVLLYVVTHVQLTCRAMEQELELSESRTRIMLSQIQPHFLFNALASISNLCEKDPMKAQKAIHDFSDYLRGNLDSLKRTAPIPFSRELKHIKIYLSLEKMRFESDLHIVYDIEASGFLVPELAVQPLVENAVKHGVGKKLGGGTVTIAAREEETCFTVIVSDDGIGFDPTQLPSDGRSHIGIDNARSRLAAMIGGTLTIESTKGAGTVATIQIPKEKKT